MNREIKFRGKQIENNQEWVYGSLLIYPENKYVIVYFDQDGNELSYDVDPATVGQFTGLCDSKGKEIYEGDYVSVSYSHKHVFSRHLPKMDCSFNGVVVYDVSNYQIKITKGGNRHCFTPGVLTSLDYLACEDMVEVIGIYNFDNIHGLNKDVLQRLKGGEK